MLEPIQSTAGAVSLMMLATSLFGPLAGPYVAIVLSATGGALWALSAATLKSRVEGAWLMLRCIVTAVVLTSALAKLAGDYLGIDSREAFAVVSFVIGLLGNHWLGITKAVSQRLQGLIATGGRP